MAFWVLVLVMIGPGGEVASASVPVASQLECQSAMVEIKERGKAENIRVEGRCLPSDEFGLKHPSI